MQNIFNASEELPHIKDWTEVPYQRVPLPTKGKLYPEDHPLHNEEYVEIKAPTATEENILSSEALLKKGTVTDELIKSCLSRKDIDPQALFAGDKNAILVAIRVSGWGKDYNVVLRCLEKSCRKEFPNVFDLSMVQIKSLPEDCITENGLFKFVLPKSKRVVRFSLLTDKDLFEINQTQENRKKAFIKAKKTPPEVSTKVTDQMIKAIKSINDISNEEQLVSLIKNMDLMDSRAFRNYMNKISPGIDMVQKAHCKECGVENEYSIPITIEFFWPELDSIV